MSNTVEIVPKEIFKALEKKLTAKDIQRLLYLELLHNILQAYPGQTASLSSPTSPYFIEGQTAPLKHASLILRIIKNKKLPQVILRPQNPEQLVNFLLVLWQKANAAQETLSLQEKADSFIQKVFEPELFELAFAYGQEYYTFCLERI